MRKFQNSILPPPYKSQAKVGKIGKFFCLLICVLTLATNVVTAQSKLWLHGNKIINLSDSYNITVSNLPTPSGPAGLVYDGSMPTLTEHVEYDSNGNILFFMIDGKIYNKDGYLLVKETSAQGSLYEYYPEKALNYTLLKVPGECNKFYLLQNLNASIDAPSYWATPRFFISVLDLDLVNQFFPNDPDRSGALVNWENVPANYPIALLSVQGASQAPSFNIVNARCGSIISLSTSIPGNPGQNSIAFTQFTPYWVDETQIFLNESKYGSSYNWVLNGQGIQYIGGSPCSVSFNNITNYYEKRSISSAQSSIKLFMGRRNTGASTISELGQNFQQISCESSLPAANVITSESTVDGLFFYNLQNPAGLQYVNVVLGTSHSIPGSSIPNLNLWLKGCHFRRAVYQGLESIFVFHEQGVDVIKGTSNPLNLTIQSNVINIPSPFANNATLISALSSTDTNLNYPQLYASSIVSNPTRLIIAPIQVYNHIDEIIPTSECCVFETNYNAEGNITVTSNQIWSPGNNPFNNSQGPIHVSGDIVIQAGRSLTINNLEIRFAENSDVVVSAGAYLRIESNSKLTSYSCDGMMWRGIDLLSSPNLNQALSPTPATGIGRVQINNSIIEHALTAIQVGTNNSNAGGLIRTIEATFLNCRVGVDFKPYALVQFSTFENSKWITNQKLKDPDLLLGSMVHLQGVSGTVRFKNCTFVNSASWSQYNMSVRQEGIHCTNSSIKVENSGSATLPYVSTSDLGRAFYRLKSGIVYSGTSTSTLSVTRMAFDECNTGLEVTNAVGVIINDNLFDVPVSAAIANIKPRGSILTGCTGFSYERNALEAASFNALTQNVGSMFVNCGVDNNLSYRNTYSNLWKGQEVQGNNADPLASIGLQLRCNTYTNCQYDQYLGDDDYWRNNQGDVDAIGNLANNKFSLQFPSCAANKYDMYISPIRNYTTWFFDYFVPNSEWYIPNSFDDTYADCSSPHIQVVVPGAFEDNTNPTHVNICPTEPLPPINSNGFLLLQEKQDAVVAARENYQFIVDKNEKEYLLNNINSAFPSESGLIKDLLLQKTPLSDEVMKAFIGKIDAMDPWHVTQVLLANAPLTKDVLYALENSESLSGFFMNFIYEAQATGAINLRKLLELEISARETDKHLTFVQLMSQADSLFESSALQTEYASLMEKYGTDDAKKWQLEYLRSTNPTLSAEIFTSLADKPEHKDWSMLKNIEWSIPDSVETLDSITVSLIEEIAFNPKSDGYPLALALLEKYGYDAVVAEPEIPLNYRSMQLGEKKDFQLTPIEFDAFPNPTSTNTFVTYPKEADGFGYIEFWNNQGMLLKRELCSENGIKEINLEAWSSGVYLLKLVVNEKQISSLKIVKL
jgi:hypothetical protein